MSPEDNSIKPEPLVTEEEGLDPEARVVPSKKIRMFDNESGLGTRRDDTQFTRKLNLTGAGATRCRTFHARLSDSGLTFLDEQINEWLEKHPGVEIKFSNTTVGVVEAKRSDPNLIITVWY